MLRTELIFLAPVPANQMELFFVHSTTRNAPYVQPRLESILELCWTFPFVVCDVFLCFVTFPYGVLGQVWYLIIWIPDLCLLPYFDG